MEFLRRAPEGVRAVLADGLPVRGYFCRSLLDNFERQKGFAMTFGLIAVDRATMERHPKESLRYLGSQRGNNVRETMIHSARADAERKWVLMKAFSGRNTWCISRKFVNIFCEDLTRADDLGRIVIPKEIRRTVRIREGEYLRDLTNLKIYV